jgi:hypothetical protein
MLHCMYRVLLNSTFGVIAVALILSLATSRSVLAHRDCPRAECEKTRQKIAKLESRMRQGYTVSAGRKMQDELRRLRKLRSKQCR